MYSPVEKNIIDFVRIDRRKSDPIYLQLVFQFIHLFRIQVIPENTLLPGTRIIAQILNVHRQTVVKAMNELSEQGWVEIQPHVGIFAKNPEKDLNQTVFQRKRANFFQKSRKRQHYSFLLDSPFEENQCRIQLDDGQPNLKMFDIRTLSRNYQNAFQRKNVFRQLEDFSNRENSTFIANLCNYLNLIHSFQINETELVTADSKELLLYAISQLSIGFNDIVLIGAFSNYYANMIFQQVGAQLKTVPTDENGMDIDFIETRFSKGEIKCIYLNSASHYPTTATLSEERRKKLIQLSEEYDFIIIEENEDFEINYQSTSFSSLFQHQEEGNIVFIGSFGRFLPPTFQVNFLLASSDLIIETKKYLQILDPHGDVVKQQVLSEMITNGDINRYRWKAIRAYEKKRNFFLQAVNQELGNVIRCVVPSFGFAVWMEFHTPISLIRLAQKCYENDVFLPRINIYQNKDITALRMGFGALSEEEVKTVVGVFSEAIFER